VRCAPQVPKVTIKNFGDHAANERTFLAWVRTSIAVTAFGFLVERFDLFLAMVLPNGSPRIAGTRQEFGHWAGLVLIIAGVAMVLMAALRFVRAARDIDAPDLKPGTGSRFDIALTVLLALLGIALFFYLSHILSAKA